MPSERNFLASFVLGIGAVLLAIYALIPHLVKKAPLEAALRDSMNKAGISLDYKKFDLAAFPTLSVVLEDVNLSRAESRDRFSAKKMKVGLRFPQYWQGKILPSSVEIRQGNFEGALEKGPFKSLALQNISASVKNIGQGQAIRFDFKSDVENLPKAFSLKGMLRIPQFKILDPKTFFLDARAELKEAILEKLSGRWSFEDKVSLQSGNVSSNFHVRKKSGESSVFFAGGLEARKFVYGLASSGRNVSSPMDVSASLDFLWDLGNGDLNFQKNTLEFPFGQIDVRGLYKIGKNSFKGMHVSLSRFSLDALPQYYMPLREGIPLSLGFSGESQVELSLDGERNNLTLHGDWNMTPMLLTYAKYFSKPKNFPATLNLDFLLKDGSNLSGDFSFFLGEAVFKGAFPQLNLISGVGEMNIISNKFSMSGWEKVILPLENYKLGGGMKILANLSGNLLWKPEELKTMINLTLDGASITNSAGLGLQNIFLSFDFAPVSFELRQSRFEIGRSSFIVSGKALHPLKDPEISVKVNAPTVYLTENLEVIDALAGEILPEKIRPRFDYLKEMAAGILGKEEPVKNFVLDLNYKPDVWTIQDAQAQLLSGDLKVRGDYSPVAQTYRVNAQVDHLDLTLLAAQKPRPAVEGNLYLTLEGFGQVSDSEWQRKMSGEGILSVTAGAFSGLDLLAGLGQIPELSEVGKFANGQTRFDDLRAMFKISDGKFMTSKLDMIGSEVSAKGDGDISLTDGTLNYGLEVFLSKALSEGLLEDLGAPTDDFGGPKQLGPVPFLAAGDFFSLQLKSDPARLGDFQDDFRKRKTYKVFNNFLPEDFLLKRPTSS